MRSSLVSFFLLSFVLIQSFGTKAQVDKTRQFVKQTDVERVGLKGRVRSIITYRSSLGDSLEYRFVEMIKYDERGFIIEAIDTIGRLKSFSREKFFYNNDGLLSKHTYAAWTPVLSSVDTYLYSFSEGKQTCITHNPDSLAWPTRTYVRLYDKNGNEIEFKGSDYAEIKKYDERGFLILSRVTIYDGTTYEVSYENDDKGRVLKRSWSNSRRMDTHIYNKDGNEIQSADFDATGSKQSDHFTGYCEFDKHGNFLKSISFWPQAKSMDTTTRLIEYY